MLRLLRKQRILLLRPAFLTAVAMLVPMGVVLAQPNQEKGGNDAPSAATALADVDQKLLSWSTKDARTQLERVFDQNQASHLIAMGRLLDQEGKYGDAATRLTRAGEVAPNDPAPFVFLGEVRLRQDQAGPADEAFKRAAERARKQLEGDPKNRDAHYYLGVAEQRLKHYDAAVASLERARDMAPQDPMPYYQLGLTRAFQERWQDSVALLTEAIERNSGLAYAYYYRGLAAGRVGRNDMLINDLDRFVTLAPQAPEADRARKIIQSTRR